MAAAIIAIHNKNPKLLRKGTACLYQKTVVYEIENFQTCQIWQKHSIRTTCSVIFIFIHSCIHIHNIFSLIPVSVFMIKPCYSAAATTTQMHS
jgi:hypothetical protein